MSSRSTFAFFKPFGVLCQFSPKPGKTTLGQYLDVPKDVYPVGRLDEDSEGLLILTNDKRLNTALLRPSSQIVKTYLALVEGIPEERVLKRLREGVLIKIKNRGPYLTAPCEAEIVAPPEWLPQRVPPPVLRRQKRYCWLQLRLTEGKNRQVRRMTAALGHPTLRLVRTAIGALELKGMAPGQWQALSDSQIRLLFCRP
ncbi:MAG: pseudouridine synthase [Flavobacteriales bacterium]|nr:pseudouridine synthase [Flavobacteriales bacterium]MCX7768680.1 pseudouridine synthase [Flavobacteriales bacterium]MDW8410690.1 pseudouridine synthase [Flavobacteriales bacterium]